MHLSVLGVTLLKTSLSKYLYVRSSLLISTKNQKAFCYCPPSVKLQPFVSQAELWLTGKTWFATLIPTADSCIKGQNSFLILLCSSFNTTDAAEDRLRAKQKHKHPLGSWETGGGGGGDTWHSYKDWGLSVCVCVSIMHMCVLPHTSLHHWLLWLPDPRFQRITTLTALWLDLFVACAHTHTHLHRVTCTVSLTAGWKCHALNCMQAEQEF